MQYPMPSNFFYVLEFHVARQLLGTSADGSLQGAQRLVSIIVKPTVKVIRG